MKAVIQRAVTVDKVRQIATSGQTLSPRTSVVNSTLRRGQSVSAAQSSKVDYELGKTYGQLDADRYYGGLHSKLCCCQLANEVISCSSTDIEFAVCAQ